MTSQQPSATSRSPEKKDISGMPAMEGSGSVRGTRAAALAEEEGGGKNGKPRMKRPPSLSDIAARYVKISILFLQP